MIFEKLAALIAEQFNVDVDTVTMETSFSDDLNADSVDIVDLSMALEEEFGMEEMARRRLPPSPLWATWSASSRIKSTDPNADRTPPTAEFHYFRTRLGFPGG